MPEKVLWQYQLYGQDVGFPFRRLELYLAQIALVQAKVAGNKNLNMKDFMFETRAAVANEQEEVEGFLLEIGFNPRNK